MPSEAEDACDLPTSDLGPVLRWFRADGHPLRRAWRLGAFFSVFGLFPGMLALNGSFFLHNWEGPIALLIYIPYFFVSYLAFIFPSFMILSFAVGFGGTMLVARITDRYEIPAVALMAAATTAVVALPDGSFASDDVRITGFSALFWFAAVALALRRARPIRNPR